MPILSTPNLWRPSYNSGYARNASESKYPGLWRSLIKAICPRLGPTGLNVREVSGYSHGSNGTLTNMTLSTAWANIDGWCLDFDGSNDYVLLSNSDVLWNTTRPNAVSFWTNLDAYSPSAFPTVLNLTTEQSGGTVILLSNNASYLSPGIQAPGSSFTLHPTVDISASFINQWKHVAIVFDGVNTNSTNSYTTYVDGIVYPLTGGASYGAVTNNNRIGWEAGGSHYFNGKIDDILIYDRALSSAEVQILKSERGIIYQQKSQFASLATVTPPAPVCADTSCGHKPSYRKIAH